MITEAIIDTNALVHNLNEIRRRVPFCKIMAMLKSNGYGHGLLQVAKTLIDIDAYGVACISEAAILRRAGIKKKIVILRGFTNPKEITTIINNNLDVVIHTNEQLETLKKISVKPISAWFKIDTGMHRLGFSIEEADAAYKTLLANKNIKKPIFLMTHFACADDRKNKLTKEQLELFTKFTKNLDGLKSTANSAAIINFPVSHFDWIRPGILLFGVSPVKEKIGAELGFKPVMTLRSKLIAIKQVKKGAEIGYGSAWKCPENMPIGIVAIGYGDGYPRHAKNGTPILVNGKECKLIGRVSMDMINVDLRNYPNATVGDEVILWGPNLPIEKIAECADTISYELFCGLTSRVKYIYK